MFFKKKSGPTNSTDLIFLNKKITAVRWDCPFKGKKRLLNFTKGDGSIDLRVDRSTELF